MALDDDLKSDDQNARGDVAANLSRKKATPPQPAKKLLIKLRTVSLKRYMALPRFQPENLETNKTIFERVNEIAMKKGCTPSQLALAWLHHQGNDVCPIPGTTKIENFNDNIGALSVKLTPQEMTELESFAAVDVVKGDRFPDGFVPTWKNSDTPLSSWKAV
ncbi:hypothetical protein Ahy_Scaffold8g108552 [Arachis hypogaea]|uniref:NADP-dependent oxidoreductase domain-containing protein n=1 Tax=Arachis hypogaea TaxID=3818 RepID=A0A444WP18_ARAHY|nr:hypothetical protein Ahy_Scaffold8g108552 [Arachis hypogaea]